MSSGLPLIPQFFERFIFNWAEKRQPTAKQQITVNRQRLYILPTRHGITYFFVILLILFGAINYENSLGYMLTFLLGSLAFIGMIYTHMNLNQLSINIGQAEPVFAGQDILFPLSISHSSIATHPNLELLSDSGQITAAHLINEQSTQCKLTLSSQHRGYQSVGRIKLFTEYPLGLFHAWSWLKLDSKCLVYPAPDSHHYPLKLSEYNNIGALQSDKQGVDDFSGIRQYTPGDLPNHMAWKAIAKTGELQTKLFNSDSIQKAWIKWSSTSEVLNTEERLSILCRMVIDASDKNIVFGFDIPGLYLPPASGLQHKHRCLKALALFGHA
jgi:uncharacterized protein (DUF58 family)